MLKHLKGYLFLRYYCLPLHLHVHTKYIRTGWPGLASSFALRLLNSTRRAVTAFEMNSVDLRDCFVLLIL